MNILLTDNDIGLTFSGDPATFERRSAARAILYDDRMQVALLKVENGDYHKLPGGGVEPHEDLLQALKREIREEVGAAISIEQVIGGILEYRAEFKQIQHSSFYVCKVIGELGTPEFTEREKNDGFSLMWCPLEEALERMDFDRPTNYVGKFINKRDRMALERHQQLSK